MSILTNFDIEHMIICHYREISDDAELVMSLGGAEAMLFFVFYYRIIAFNTKTPSGFKSTQADFTRAPH
jgi:hypothetical protein